MRKQVQLGIGLKTVSSVPSPSFDDFCACCCWSAYSIWKHMDQLHRCWMKCFSPRRAATITVSKALA
jgi:hypothetical protein